MTRYPLLTLCLLQTLLCWAQPKPAYRPLDSSQPIRFTGKQVIFNQDTITLGPKAFFIDGQLPDSITALYPYVFNSVNEAAAHLTNGSEQAPMTLYLAPWVYWIDNPDDPAIRVPKEGNTPYGLVISCEWLRFQGLNKNPENIVLASNRGQTIGAQGNFTMFRFIGQGTSSENITFGNYCNVDLVYPLKPELGRPKRASAIVQAQLIHCNGDKIVARNTRFISRLNLCPFVGGKRVLFDRCHFESTDDALCGTGVYLNSTLDFYSSKPFYNTTGTGAVFLNCDIRSLAGSHQYFTKAGGQVTVVDSRFTTAANTYWGWQDVAPAETRNYQANVLLNGKTLLIGKETPEHTVDLSGKRLLDGYRFVHDGKPVYNTYNLLRGDDDWDPMGIKPLVHVAEQASGKTYTNLPVQLLVSPSGVAIETKKNEVVLTARAMRFGNYAHSGEKVQWTVAPKDSALVQLNVSEDGSRCTVIPTNNLDETKQVVVTAYTASGLEAASVVKVAPHILKAPLFRVQPKLVVTNKGAVRLDYQLAASYKDQSDVHWYRCTDGRGSNAIEVAVSRFDTPLREYALSASDVGYYLMAAIAPKHIRSKAGAAVQVVMSKPIDAGAVKTPANVLSTDFKNVSTRNQPRIIPGFWTFGHIAAKYQDGKYPVDTSRAAWYFGAGADGAANMQGLLQGREGSMYYTPVGKGFGDMQLTLQVAPFKTAGQGFSVAHLYMDVLVKFDAATMSGYALRLIRTTKYHDAVDALLIRYDKGVVTPITEPFSTTAFRAPCTIVVAVKNNQLSAQVTTGAAGPEQVRAEVLKEVRLTATVTPNAFDGIGIEYNGGSPTMIRHLKAEWK